MRFPAASPEPSSRPKAVESIFTESIRKRRSTSSPASHDPSPRSSRPRILSSISANQFWLEFRIGKISWPRGRPKYSASGGGAEQQRTARYASESVVPAAPPAMLTPLRWSAAASARAAYRFGSGTAKLSIQGRRPNATVPWAQMSQVPPPAPGARKKLSPIVVPESAGTVRARFSKVNSPRSGDQVIVGGSSTAAPGAMWKSTLLSWKPSPETGAAYHQLRSNAFHAGCTSVRSKDEPSPTTFPVMRRIPRARTESASRSTTVDVESQAPGASVSTE